MKVTILKKTINEGISARTGNEYKIKSLFVKFNDAELYEKIVAKLQKDGASIEQIERWCKPSEYKGETNFAFGLGCSSFTFDRVEAFGELDALINFKLNEQGFINAKIAIKDRIEQVLEYIEPSGAGEIVEGWATKAPAPEPASEENEKSDIEVEGKKVGEIPQAPIIEGDSQLPF